MRDTKTDPTPRKQIIIVGVLGALLSLIGFLPGLNLIMIVLPIPYIHLIYKHGHSAGRKAILLTAFFNGLFLADMIGVLWTLITFGLVAVTVGGAFHEKYTPKRTAMIAMGATVISSLLLYFLGHRIGMLSELEQVLEQNPIWNSPLVEGVTPEVQKDMIDYMLAIIPGMLASAGILVGLVNYHLAAFYLRWKGYTIPRLKPFRNWRFPRWIGLVYLILWFVLQFVPADAVTVNLLVVFMAILSGEGIALFLYYTEKWGVYAWIRIILVLFMIPFFGVIFLVGGLVDNVFRLRGQGKKA